MFGLEDVPKRFQFAGIDTAVYKMLAQKSVPVIVL